MLDVLRTPPELFLIKHPPADACLQDFADRLPDFYVFSGDSAILDIATYRRTAQKDYQKTRNGVLLSAFLVAHECKFFPPMWVLNALAAVGVGVPQPESGHPYGPTELLPSGVPAGGAEGSVGRHDLTHLAAYLRQSAGHGRSHGGRYCGLPPA